MFLHCRDYIGEGCIAVDRDRWIGHAELGRVGERVLALRNHAAHDVAVRDHSDDMLG
jgi:hypothetical protein